MEITVITPTYYSHTEPVKYLFASAYHQGIDLTNYGWGVPYTDWIQTHITDCLHMLYGLRANHVLFVDASDVIFLKPMDEIVRRYMRLGHPPMLVGFEETGMNAGCWMGERDVAIAILEYLTTLTDIPESGDPQQRWRDAYSRCQIDVYTDVMDTIFSINNFPTDACILHLAGGYSDPMTGRAERIQPIWEELGWPEPN